MAILTEGDNQHFLKAYHSILISLPNYAYIMTGGPDFILGFAWSRSTVFLDLLTCADIWDGQIPQTDYLAQKPRSLGPPLSQPENAEFTKRNKAFRVWV